MAKKRTYVAFLLDQTGSMEGIVEDVIGGFNTFLKEQQAIEGELLFSMTLFNSKNINKRYINADIQDVKPLDKNTYRPNHLTPLLDAIGQTILEIGRKKNVLFVIWTDGLENASKEFTSEKIKHMIGKKEADGWKFLFLGAEFESFADAQSIGVNLHIHAPKDKTRGCYTSMSGYVAQYRRGSSDPKWKG